MFAPNVERLLWRAANWNDTSWFTPGKSRSSALLRAVERDSPSTSTWGHTCAYTRETAPTSAPSRSCHAPNWKQFSHVGFCRAATRSLRSQRTWSRTYWRTRSRNLVAAPSLPQIPSPAAILTLTHTGAAPSWSLFSSSWPIHYWCMWNLIKTEFQPWRLKRDTHSLGERSLFTNSVCPGKFFVYFCPGKEVIADWLTNMSTELSQFLWYFCVIELSSSGGSVESGGAAVYSVHRVEQSPTEFKAPPLFWILTREYPVLCPE